MGICEHILGIFFPINKGEEDSKEETFLGKTGSSPSSSRVGTKTTTLQQNQYASPLEPGLSSPRLDNVRTVLLPYNVDKAV
eukprot:5311158-Ditylum_brightwellii.AAC.1